jgi:hypothetical protein
MRQAEDNLAETDEDRAVATQRLHAPAGLMPPAMRTPGSPPMKFTYNSGERVLDGYTLKRGIGRGGFGEVFYAISDGGKEVALKLVRGNNLDVELRGMAQCLNLKHPNLLTLYDIRTDSHGDHWVIMEYISGEPLSVALHRHSQGLPRDLTRQWFADMARGVACLHSHGIVHRDLKPGNIFVENGTVKVGDYGLSKFIASSQHSAQTQSIGTVHYMAPEISTGNYNKQIDIYASGIILYEMLTGRVPFDGESAGEILMKHLTSPPDLSKVPTEYAAIVGRALAKNPAQRYQTMTELAQAVEHLEAPKNIHNDAAVSEPSHVSASPLPVATPVATASSAPGAQLSVRSKLAELCGSLVLATVFAALACTIWASVRRINDLSEVGLGFFITVAACWMVLIPAKIWDGREGDSGLRRVVMMLLGVILGAGALWLQNGGAGLVSESVWKVGASRPTGNAGILPHSTNIPVAAGYLSYFGLAFFALRWWKLPERQRAQRFSLGPVLAAGFWAFVLLYVWPLPDNPHATLPLLVTAVIVQLVSPWQPPVPPAGKRMRLRYT